MYCRYCGRELSQNARFCPSCGKPVQEQQPNAEHAAPYGNSQGIPCAPKKDVPNAGWAVAGFFLPLLGFILYLVWQTQYPNRSKMCGLGALIGVITQVVLYLLGFFILFSLLFIPVYSSCLCV